MQPPVFPREANAVGCRMGYIFEYLYKHFFNRHKCDFYIRVRIFQRHLIFGYRVAGESAYKFVNCFFGVRHRVQDKSDAHQSIPAEMQARVDYPAVAFAAYHGFFCAHQGHYARLANDTAINATFIFARDIFAHAACGLVNNNRPFLNSSKYMLHRECYAVFLGQDAERGGDEHEAIAVGIQGEANSNFVFLRERGECGEILKIRFGHVHKVAVHFYILSCNRATEFCE